MTSVTATCPFQHSWPASSEIIKSTGKVYRGEGRRGYHEFKTMVTPERCQVCSCKWSTLKPAPSEGRKEMTTTEELAKDLDRLGETALAIKAERDRLTVELNAETDRADEYKAEATRLAARCERLEEALVCTEYALANPASSDQEFALAAARAALADKAKP